MNHTERNCTRVAEDDKEQGYGWGLEMKASPRKGFYKHKEEVENLKLKKTLFITKPNSPLIENIETHEQPSIGKEISMAVDLELNVEKGSGGLALVIMMLMLGIWIVHMLVGILILTAIHNIY